MTALDPTTSALILIDLMPRIVALPTEPSSGQDVLDRCVALADGLRARGTRVVWVRVERPGVDAQPPGSELAVTPQPGDIEVVKRTWGAFQGTGLDAMLRDRGVEQIVLGGLITNFGVESTGRIADEHGYAVTFVSDAMAGLDEPAHRFAVDYMFPRIGTVCTSAELLSPS